MPTFTTTQKKMIGGGLMAFFAAIAGVDSFYSVQPTDRANIRRFGTVENAQPLKPGPHWKIPLIDHVDTLQTSLTMLHVPAFSVNTVDNQKITLEFNFNFTIPDNQVNHLLYEVGRAGNVDIADSVIPVARDRAARVFARQNTTNISLNREQIQKEVTDAIFEAVTKQFGIMPQNLQISTIGYSDTFISSNENAVKAKNDAIAEQNKQVVESAKAAQKVIAAKGEADSAIERATGESRSAILIAEGDKQKQILDGEGQSARLQAEMKPFGSPQLYIEYMKAKSGLLWNGATPQVVTGGSGTGGATIVVPMAPIPAPAAH